MTHPTILASLDRPAHPATMLNSSDLATFFTVNQEHWVLSGETKDGWTFLDETPASLASPSTFLSATEPPTPPPSSVSDDGYGSCSECSDEPIIREPYSITRKYSREYPEIEGYPWPIDEATNVPRVILDIGTGSGYWAIETACAYPGAMVHGVDRVLIQPKWAPLNCVFILDNEDPEDWRPVRHHKDANLIRVDRICGDKPLLLSVLGDASNYCAAGVVVEIHDITVRLKDPNGATPFHQFHRDLEEAYLKDYRTWNLADSYAPILREYGYKRVECVERKISLHARRTKEEENVYKEWKAGLASHAMKLFCERLGRDPMQAIVELAAARNSLEEGIEGELVTMVVYGVKPAKLCINLGSRYTALHRAAACGSASTVQKLLKKGADANARDYNNQTSLHLAARNKHQEVAEELLSQQHINLNALEPSGYTPLMCAVMSGATGIVGLLLETEGVDVEPTSPTQRPLLQLAIEAGHIDIIQRLLQDPRFNISCCWGYNSPLLASIRAGRDPVTLFVLSQGGLNDVQTPLWESALLLATRKGSLAVVKEILKHDKVDVNSTDYNRWNALLWATVDPPWLLLKIMEIVRWLFYSTII
ncbi:ankyrin repeat-containing domain protein [Aspergillus heterothallicus]